MPDRTGHPTEGVRSRMPAILRTPDGNRPPTQVHLRAMPAQGRGPMLALRTAAR